MRMAGECFNRRQFHLAPFNEEGRGLGFSIGGWHPFRINTYLPTLKKLDPLANTGIGKAIWKPIEKIDRSINKDFAKAKKWSQDHRKELQIAAAIAAAAVGGAYALGYLGTGGTAAASTAAGTSAAAGGAATAAGTSAASIGAEAAAAAAASSGTATMAATAFVPEVLTPLATSTAGAGLTSLVPATVAGTTAAGTAAASGGFLSTLSSVAGTAGSIGKGVLTTMAALKALSPQQAAPMDVSVGGFGSGPAYGYMPMGGGGGGSLGPAYLPPDQSGPVAPEASTLPPWAIPAGLAALALFLIKE